MAAEIEAKMRVDDFAPVREALKSARAKQVSEVLETNTFFDTPDRALLAKDSGLRLRINRYDDGREEYVITFKGPLQSGQLKERDEIELTIDMPDSAVELFKRLGYEPELSFEKRRESWTLGNCKIELDEMPYLGKFIEIEGPDEAIVMQVREKLGLGERPLEKRGYISLLSEYLKSHKIADRQIKLTTAPR